MLQFNPTDFVITIKDKRSNPMLTIKADGNVIYDRDSVDEATQLLYDNLCKTIDQNLGRDRIEALVRVQILESTLEILNTHPIEKAIEILKEHMLQCSRKAVWYSLKD